ncbi:MAG: enoyl-CoA hydratase-related protein [Ginsengibacter sp.]
MSVVLFEIKNSVAFITLNRPEKYNAFNRSMALQLQGFLQQSNEDENVRCIVITGNGKGFCAGQDIEEVLQPDGPPIEMFIAEHYNPVVRLIRSATKPVIAAVNGVAAGAGANMAFCCDIIIATASASFIQAFGKIGLIPDCGGTYFLPRLIGFQKASALMLLNEKISATEAEKIGLIYKVFEDTEFASAIQSIAETLCKLPPQALALTKEALNASAYNSLEEQLAVEDRLQTVAGKTLDFKEGISAFVQKRKPVFTGK